MNCSKYNIWIAFIFRGRKNKQKSIRWVISSETTSRLCVCRIAITLVPYGLDLTGLPQGCQVEIEIISAVIVRFFLLVVAIVEPRQQK
jgi:hypothetical protein